MKNKKSENEKKLEYWIQKYLEAKQSGDTKLIRAYEAIIKKLGGNIPKL